MSAASLDITIEQGSTFFRTVTIKDENNQPVDLNGETIRGQIRAKADSTTVLATFTCTLLNQTTNMGQFTWTLSAELTAALPIGEQPTPTTTRTRKDNVLVYDLERVKVDTTVERIFQGAVTVSPEVTR